MFGLFQLDGRLTCSAWGPGSRALGVGHAHLFLSAETNSGRSNLRRAGSAAWSQQELTAKRILLIYQRHGAHVHLFPDRNFSRILISRILGPVSRLALSVPSQGHAGVQLQHCTASGALLCDRMRPGGFDTVTRLAVQPLGQSPAAVSKLSAVQVDVT